MTNVESAKDQEHSLMQQLLASVFMAVGAAIAIIGLDGRFIAMNPAFSRLLRYPARKLDGCKFWDLVDDADIVKAAASGPFWSEHGGYREFDAGLILGDGTVEPMHATLSSVEGLQFKSFRLVTLWKTSQAVVAHPVGTEKPVASEVIVAGNIKLVGLETIKAALGPRWTAHAEKAMLFAESILRNRLGPKDVFSRTNDQGFVICFADIREEEAAFRAAMIAREIRNRLIGDADDPVGSAVTAVTLSMATESTKGKSDQPNLSALEQRLEAARAEAERRARAEISIVKAGATLEPEALFDRYGKAVPIAIVALRREQRERLDIALATLPSLEGIDADLDILNLTLATEAILDDIGAARHGAYLLPVDFAMFAHRKRLTRFLEICGRLQDAVRQRLTFLLSGVPRAVSQNRLVEVIRLLKPFGKGIGLDLDDTESVPTDLAQYRIPVVTLTAEEILATARRAPEKFNRLSRQIRLNSARLIARHVYGESERNMLAGLGADLFSVAQEGRTAAQEGRTAMPAPSSETEKGWETTAFAAAIAHSSSGILVTDPRKADNPILLCNPAFSKMVGYTPQELIGRNPRILQGPRTDRRIVTEIREALAKGQPINRELINYRKDGTLFHNDINITPVRDAAGQLVAYVGIHTDSTEFRRTESNRREIARLFSELSESIPGFIFQRTVRGDGSNHWSYISPSFRRLVGIPNDDTVVRLEDWIHPEDAQGVDQAKRQSGETLSPVIIEYRLVGKDGQIHWIRSHSRPTRNASGTVVWNGVAVDVTPEKTLERQLSFLSDHDTLTGLLNRHRFRRRLCRHIFDIQQQGGVLCLFYVNLSRFQSLKIGFGSQVGDAVLKVVSERIARFDWAKEVGRIGGDDFTIATIDDGNTDMLARALALSAEIAKTIEVQEQHIKVQACIGGAAYPGHVAETERTDDRIAEALEKAADIALYAAKRAGPGSCRIYSTEIDDRVRNAGILQQSLHLALDRGQFKLNYQPVVELDTGRILGAEALIRWEHPKLGWQRPDQFIPLAEESGLIVPLGSWVMEEALRQLRQWEQAGVGQPRIAVNVAAAQLQHQDSLRHLRDLILKSGVNPSQIEIELTESALIDPTAVMLANLTALRDLGVTVAIDDFGTGYSSFRYLRSLPINKLKIDQSFIRHMAAESSDEAIVKGMVSIARDLDLSVVVEGVETAEQRDILLHLGCKIGQGYFYSAPLNAEDFAWMLAHQIRLPAMAGAASADLKEPAIPFSSSN